MGHEITEIDNVGLRGEPAWHGLGTVIQDNISAVAAAELFGLTWPVERYPLAYRGPDGAYHDVSTHVANVRTKDCDGKDIKHLLGVVGADYKVCQNRELAEFTDALAQTGKVTIESCGSIKGGKRVWFLARGDSFTIGSADKVYPYVLVSNGHDGTQAIRITPTTVRVVCSNTLHMVIPKTDGARPESAAFIIRHSGHVADKLEQAREALKYYGNTLAHNREMFEAMQSRTMDRNAALHLFANAYSAFWETATNADLNDTDEKQRKLARHRMRRMKDSADAFLARYDAEQSKLSLGDTSWAAFNALTGFLQHDKRSRGKDDSARVERRMESNLFGVNASRTHEVLAATLAV